ncbi:MAG: Flp family type IVb pilin [Rhizobiales bacterium]|nr:Flp family type IVb pilin [Hyphomicrobiales bacterium]
MRPLLIRFLNDRSGATAIEYALIAMGIAVAIVSVIQALGTTTAGKYQSVQDAFQQTGP